MVGWKRVERGFELVSDLGTAQDIQRVRAVDAAEEWDIRLIDVPILVQLGLTPRGLTHEVNREIGDDPIQPGEERRSAVEGIKSAVNAQKCLLNDLTGILFIAQQPERDREGTPLVALNQLLEREFIAFLGAFDEDTILLRFELSARSV